MKYGNYIKQLREETGSADIATVDTKLDMTRRDPSELKHLSKGKKCKLHKQLNCDHCVNEHYND